MEATATASVPPKRLKLLCYLVGVEEGDIFPVDITDDLTVGDLKDEIKAKKQNTITCDADQLHLFLATTADSKDWLHVRSEDVRKMMNGEIPPAIQAVMREDKKLSGGLTIAVVLGGAKPVPSHLHVLVSLGGSHFGPKRMRSDDVFKTNIKRIKLNPEVVDANGQPRETKYFDIGDFPPMVHAATDFTRIMERDAYRVIFDGMMAHVSNCLSNRSKGNVIVTGNPGIGKSRFYLYCAFHLVTRQLDIVEKLPPYRLLLNCKQVYHRYDTEKTTFIPLSPEDVRRISSEKDVVRLIDGDSDWFVPWRGINILFASPGVTDTKDLEKDKCRQFVMPVWTLEEIEECNELFKMDENLSKLALSDSDLKERYRVFGGIARSVFSDDVDADRSKLDEALNSNSAMKMINYAQSIRSVKEKHYSHRVLQMVPDNASTYATTCSLSFLSDYVGESLISKVQKDSLQELSVFAVAHMNDETNSTATLRGKIFELLSHKWFLSQDQLALEFRSLDVSTEETDRPSSSAAANVASDNILMLTTQEKMKYEVFETVDEICKVPDKVMYYRPKAKNFGALDVLIVDGIRDRCYGLQMTIGKTHPVAWKPLYDVLKHLRKINLAQDFCLCFVVPPPMRDSYKRQSIRTNQDTLSRNPGDVGLLPQFVGGVNAFGT